MLRGAEGAPPADLQEGREVIVVNARSPPSQDDDDHFLPWRLLRLLKLTLLFTVGRRGSADVDEWASTMPGTGHTWAWTQPVLLEFPVHAGGSCWL